MENLDNKSIIYPQEVIRCYDKTNLDIDNSATNIYLPTFKESLRTGEVCTLMGGTRESVCDKESKWEFTKEWKKSRLIEESFEYISPKEKILYYTSTGLLLSRLLVSSEKFYSIFNQISEKSEQLELFSKIQQLRNAFIHNPLTKKIEISSIKERRTFRLNEVEAIALIKNLECGPNKKAQKYIKKSIKFYNEMRKKEELYKKGKKSNKI